MRERNTRAELFPHGRRGNNLEVRFRNKWENHMEKHSRQQARIFRTHLAANREVTLNYLLSLPPEYNPQRADRWPLVLFLHGSSMRGTDVNLVKHQGLAKLVNQGQSFPFILLSPQCPPGQWWTWPQLLAALVSLLEEVEGTYAVDSERIYVTGLSMGGFGTWSLAMAYPQRFAAIVPICGLAEDLDKLGVIRQLPVWAFHGDQDMLVPVQGMVKTVEALKACDGNVKLTIYPGIGHNAADPAYADPELYRWLLCQRRQSEAKTQEM
jgi:predicted peptidase